MTVKQQRIVTTVIVSLVLVVIAWRWLFPPYPDEEQVITFYAAHKQEFAALTKMIESHCPGQLTPETKVAASHINPRMNVFCDYNGTIRFILGVHGLMTITPEQAIGLTYTPGDATREGIIVPVLKPHMQEVGSVYLRQVESHWYVFTQDTD